MPHLYCDSRSENEERQKLLHLAMLRLLVVELGEAEGDRTPATWEAIRRVSVTLAAGGRVMVAVRKAALLEVARDLKGVTLDEVFGTTAPPRRQFTVTFVRQKVVVMRHLAKQKGLQAAKLQRQPSQVTPSGESVVVGVALPIALPCDAVEQPSAPEQSAQPGRGDALKQERDEPEAEKAEGDAESQGPAAAPLASEQATWEAIQRVSVTEAAGGRENKNACWRYSMLVRERAMSSGWPAGLQSEQRQHDLVRVIVLLAPQYACARACRELWLAHGPTERTATT